MEASPPMRRAPRLARATAAGPERVLVSSTETILCASAVWVCVCLCMRVAGGRCPLMYTLRVSGSQRGPRRVSLSGGAPAWHVWNERRAPRWAAYVYLCRARRRSVCFAGRGAAGVRTGPEGASDCAPRQCAAPVGVCRLAGSLAVVIRNVRIQSVSPVSLFLPVSSRSRSPVAPALTHKPH